MKQKEECKDCNKTEGGVQRMQRDRMNSAENAMRQKSEYREYNETEE
jgi:hypothetical protein